MFEPSKRILEIIESETLAMTKKARELKESGKDVISLSIGEPDFNTPIHICDAAFEAMKNGFTHYPPVLGLLQFREAICRKFKNENGLDYLPNQIIVSNGAKHSIINAVLSIINPGDEVIIPAPYWVSYPSMVAYAGGVSVEIPTSIANNFKPGAAEIEAAITPKTKLLIFSSPTNPSGSVWTKKELEDIAEVLRKHPDIFIISDEIYEKINYVAEHVSIASMPGMKDRTAVVNGLAKGYAMTGWRIGYLAGPTWLVSACEKMQGLFTSGANSISQMAGIAALEGDQKPVAAMRDTFRKRRDTMYALLKDIPGIQVNNPSGAFYFFPDIRAFLGKSYGSKKMVTAEDLCYYLLEEAGVATVSGKAFGIPQCIRMSYATDEASIIKACERMKTALTALQ
ncbi:MAG: pyridoxal phosphate-dependent aminotransferase [Bacteroidetes bacterium]|nr:pyridoxal phosphate-dependent aminotransferase [Bacteroidota bacterium]